jgi:hypothetical protein
VRVVPVSRQKPRRLTMSRALLRYRESLRPWLELPSKVQRRIAAASELLQRQGREVPLDGQAVIVGETDDSLAINVGETIRLVGADEVRGLAAYQRTVDRIANDFAETGQESIPALVEAIRLSEQNHYGGVSSKLRQCVSQQIKTRPLVALLVGYALLLLVCVTLGGGIFYAVPNSSAPSGVYLINKFTGGVSFVLGPPSRQ